VALEIVRCDIPEESEYPSGPPPRVLTAGETAALLGVSESWVRRHRNELPLLRVGRLIRFDPFLLSQLTQARMQSGKSLKPERNSMLFRYQRGYVYLTGKKVKVWYGMFREDIRTPEGQVRRRQRHVRLGTRGELPTRSAARSRLAELFRSSTPTTEMNFQDLVERWHKAVGPTMKTTTLRHYRNALRAYVLPTFADRMISNINREDIQALLAEKAMKYSCSALRSMRVVLSLTLGWANDCGWLEKNPCTRIKLPQQTGGRMVTRTVLSTKQVLAITAELEEPYATLVLFLATSGLRIGEAIAIKWSDFDRNEIRISRRICGGDVDCVKTESSVRRLPVDSALVSRMRNLGTTDWVFCSRGGTPVNPGNALKRYVRPTAKKLGIPLGGWHDFRHTLTTTMRRSGVHPKVISGILGHAKVALAMDVYDHADVEDFRQPLAVVAGELLRNVTKTEAAG
jgi:integrase